MTEFLSWSSRNKPDHVEWKKNIAVRDCLTHLWFDVAVMKSCSESEQFWDNYYAQMSGLLGEQSPPQRCAKVHCNCSGEGFLWMQFDWMEFHKSVPENGLLGVSKERCGEEEPSGVGSVNETSSCRVHRHGNTRACIVSLRFFKQEL